MTPNHERPIKVTENVAAWKVSDPGKANRAMEKLAETYLEDDHFPQGDNEEVSLLCTGTRIALRVTRTYDSQALSVISPDKS